MASCWTLPVAGLYRGGAVLCRHAGPTVAPSAGYGPATTGPQGLVLSHELRGPALAGAGVVTRTRRDVSPGAISGKRFRHRGYSCHLATSLVTRSALGRSRSHNATVVVVMTSHTLADGLAGFHENPGRR